MTALPTLRTLGGPASATDCARAILAEKGLPDAGLSKLATRIATALAQKAATGQVRRLNGDGRQVRWEVARQGLTAK